jgi:hypothetical protein
MVEGRNETGKSGSRAIYSSVPQTETRSPLEMRFTGLLAILARTASHLTMGNALFVASHQTRASKQLFSMF